MSTPTTDTNQPQPEVPPGFQWRIPETNVDTEVDTEVEEELEETQERPWWMPREPGSCIC